MRVPLDFTVIPPYKTTRSALTECRIHSLVPRGTTAPMVLDTPLNMAVQMAPTGQEIDIFLQSTLHTSNFVAVSSVWAKLSRL